MKIFAIILFFALTISVLPDKCTAQSVLVPPAMETSTILGRVRDKNFSEEANNTTHKSITLMTPLKTESKLDVLSDLNKEKLVADPNEGGIHDGVKPVIKGFFSWLMANGEYIAFGLLVLAVIIIVSWIKKRCECLCDFLGICCYCMTCCNCCRAYKR